MTWQEKMDFLQKKKPRPQPLSQVLRKTLHIKSDEMISDKLQPEVEKLTREIVELGKASGSDAEIVARHMVGDDMTKVADKMGVSARRVAYLMRTAFPDPTEMAKVLEKTLLGNAMLASAVFAEKADELSARDAALAGGIFAQRYLEVKRDREGKPPETLNVNVVVRLQSVLENLKQLKGRTIDEQ